MTGRATAIGRDLVLGAEALLFLAVTCIQVEAAPDPTIEFLKPADGATLADDSALIEVSYAGDLENPIVRVEVFVDGKRQFEYRSPGGERRGTRSFSWELEPVAAGEHVLRAQATDKSGQVASATVTVHVEASGGREALRRRFEEFRRRLRRVLPPLEILPRHGGRLPPPFFGDGGGLWNPTDPPRRPGEQPWDPGPGGTSQLWFPTTPPRLIGPTARLWRNFQIGPDGGEFEFRLPNGRGRGILRIIPPTQRKKHEPPADEDN